MTQPQVIQLGLDTFGDISTDDVGAPVPADQVLRNVVDQAVLADEVGLHAIGLGEHHRPDFAITAPEVVLATIASRTRQIHLGSAVSVLSTDDPVRLYERFATLDGLSAGRAEVVVGRGSFTESFGLFGYDLAHYEVLFEEKLDLFMRLIEERPVTWSGTVRSPLRDQNVFPRSASGRLTTWVGVGGSPQSVARAARYRAPLMLAIIGGPPSQFQPFVALYRRLLDDAGVAQLPVGVHSPGHIAETDEQAREELFGHFQAQRAQIGRERGWPPVTRLQFERDASADGALYVGSPETVAAKIARTCLTLGATRFDLKYANGAMPHSQLMRSIELYGTKVAPLVTDLVAEQRP